jgi:hypothetical protein
VQGDSSSYQNDISIDESETIASGANHMESQTELHYGLLRTLLSELFTFV